MNKIRISAAFLALFAVFSLGSCSSDNEPIDPSIIIDPEDPNVDPPGASTGDYWPAALNNEWIFERDGVTQPAMKMVSINSIGGNTYFTFNEQTGTGQVLTGSAVTRLRKSNAAYHIRIEQINVPAQNGMPGSTTSGAEYVLLKDNLPVGGTWTDSYTQTTTYTDPAFPVITMNVVNNGFIVEKGITVTVNDETYTDVIKTKLVQNVTMMTQTTATTTYYWFAKGVGPIKITTEGTGMVSNQELLSYTLN